MIGTSELFASLKCPFGKDCERPYCPFKHPATAQNPAIGPSTSSQKGLSLPERGFRQTQQAQSTPSEPLIDTEPAEIACVDGNLGAVKAIPLEAEGYHASFEPYAGYFPPSQQSQSAPTPQIVQLPSVVTTTQSVYSTSMSTPQASIDSYASSGYGQYGRVGNPYAMKSIYAPEDPVQLAQKESKKSTSTSQPAILIELDDPAEPAYTRGQPICAPKPIPLNERSAQDAENAKQSDLPPLSDSAIEEILADSAHHSRGGDGKGGKNGRNKGAASEGKRGKKGRTGSNEPESKLKGPQGASNSASTSSSQPPAASQPSAYEVFSVVPSAGEKRRVAHAPQQRLLPASQLLADPNASNRGRGCLVQLAPLDVSNKKVPYKDRCKYLKLLYDEFLKADASMGSKEAMEMALREEKSILDRATGRIGYVSGNAQFVKRLREASGTVMKSPSKDAPSISHHTVLAGRNVDSITIGLNRKRKSSQLSEAEFYDTLNKKFLMTAEQMWENGFARWVKGEEGKEAELAKYQDTKNVRRSIYAVNENLKRVCCRCGIEFTVNTEGDIVFPADATCRYHWGKAWKRRSGSAGIETRYTCCSSGLDDGGCVVAERHVHQMNPMAQLKQFVATPRPFGVGDPRSRKVYAMDCEMVYTKQGTALARLTVVDVLDDAILDVLVKPEGELVDCNTKFSGLTREKLETAEVNLQGARNKLFELVNSDTILLGHSLEGDLRALRLVHTKVVDTSVVFPHRQGPPLKRALKTLAAELLQKIIQEDETGHDSRDDASVCMQLMLQKCRANASGGGGRV